MAHNIYTQPMTWPVETGNGVAPHKIASHQDIVTHLIGVCLTSFDPIVTVKMYTVYAAGTLNASLDLERRLQLSYF